MLAGLSSSQEDVRNKAASWRFLKLRSRPRDLNLCVVASNASVQASEPFFRERAFFQVAAHSEGLGPRAGLGSIPL